MTDSDIATKTFLGLMGTFYFWKTQWKLLAILGLGILLIFGLWEFTYPSAEQLATTFGIETIFAWGAIFIHPTLLMGVWIMLRLAANIQIEHATARVIKEKAEQEREEIMGSSGVIRMVETLDVQCLPPDVKDRKLDMVLLFKQIQKDAEEYMFESIPVLTQHYQEKAGSRLVYLNGVQRYALSAGILGTFLGLLFALSSVEANLANVSGDLKNINNLLANLGNISGDLFNALRISFRTSIAGLQVAIIMGLILMYAHQQLSAYFITMEEMTSETLSLMQKAAHKESGFSNELAKMRNLVHKSTEEIKEAIQQQGKQVDEAIQQHGKQVDDKRKLMEKRLDKQTQTIEEGLVRLKDTKGEFEQFLAQFDTTLEKLKTQQNTFNNGVQTTYNLFQGEVQGLLKSLEKMNKDSQSLPQVLKKMTDLAISVNKQSTQSAGIFMWVGKTVFFVGVFTLIFGFLFLIYNLF
jgi:predicted  nucleic acid-binding Zn-ribbon protein